MPDRSYEGDPLGATEQYITERPELEEESDDVEYATDPEPDGEATVKNVPMPGGSSQCQFPGCDEGTEEAYSSACRAAVEEGDE